MVSECVCSASECYRPSLSIYVAKGSWQHVLGSARTKLLSEPLRMKTPTRGARIKHRCSIILLYIFWNVCVCECVCARAEVFVVHTTLLSHPRVLTFVAHKPDLRQDVTSGLTAISCSHVTPSCSPSVLVGRSVGLSGPGGLHWSCLSDEAIYKATSPLNSPFVSSK